MNDHAIAVGILAALAEIFATWVRKCIAVELYQRKKG
jgi:hypothetical protein